jgi:hypothetical protein
MNKLAWFCIMFPLAAAGADGDAATSAMPGMLGAYPMTREASGTSWQPDSSPHEGMHSMGDTWTSMLHGNLNLIYGRQGGPRGDSKAFSNSMLMLMGSRRLGPGTLGLKAMVSLDPLMGKSGYPELLQTGETADGSNRLIDRQHPHDLFMELSASYAMPLSDSSSVFVYAGLPGEPALGPPAFMHRFSGADNPEAPIAHHWLDSTHVSFGVTTLGVVVRNLKLEASAFRGREPDQFRYNIESGRLDSAAARLTLNPSPNWSAQISRGHIVSPEALEPGVSVNRTTASLTANFPFGADNWQSTLAWGRNAPSTGAASNAYVIESAYAVAQTHTIFMRGERVDKNELFAPGSAMAGASFRVAKLTAGYIRDFPQNGRYVLGVGGLLSAYSMPAALTPAYGANPVSGMLFLRAKIR